MKLRVMKDNEAMLVKKGDEFEVINVFEVFSCDGESERKYEIDFETHKQSVFGKSGWWYEIVEKENDNINWSNNNNASVVEILCPFCAREIDVSYSMNTRFIQVTPKEALEQLAEDSSKLYLYDSDVLINVRESGLHLDKFAGVSWFVKY